MMSPSWELRMCGQAQPMPTPVLNCCSRESTGVYHVRAWSQIRHGFDEVGQIIQGLSLVRLGQFDEPSFLQGI